MSASAKRIGDIEVMAVSDGVLRAPLDVVLGMDKAEAERLAGKKDAVNISVNAFLLERNGKWALVDVGSGNTMGPTLGKLPDNLRASGVPPDKIETIFLTHLHPDHSNGLVDDAGHAVYPNAEIVLHETEAGFWLDRDAATGENERVRSGIAKCLIRRPVWRDRRHQPKARRPALFLPFNPKADLIAPVINREHGPAPLVHAPVGFEHGGLAVEHHAVEIKDDCGDHRSHGASRWAWPHTGSFIPRS